MKIIIEIEKGSNWAYMSTVGNLKNFLETWQGINHAFDRPNKITITWEKELKNGGLQKKVDHLQEKDL